MKKKKVPKRLQGKRARMIVDYPADKTRDIVGLMQMYAQKHKVIILSVPAVGIIEPEIQHKIRASVNSVLKTKDVDDITDFDLAKELHDMGANIKIMGKDDPEYIG